MRNMRNITIVLMTISAVITLTACGSRDAAPAKSTLCVEVINPIQLDPLIVNNYSGRVKEGEQINVAFKTKGQIEKIAVSRGDRVTKGQFIANIDSSDYLFELRNYELQYNQLKVEVERLKLLYESHSISKNDYEKALTGLKRLEIAVEGCNRKVAYTNLYAPESGIITDVFYSATELIDAGMTMLSLLTDSDMEVTFDMPVSEYLQRDNFIKISCSPTFCPEIIMPMKVLSITPKADNNQLYRVHLAFEEPVSELITPGMAVSVKIERSDNERYGLKIPLSSVCEQNTETYVWLVGSDNILKRQPIVLGPIEKDCSVTVLSGLKSDDRVVRAGTSKLSDGEQVRVVPQPTKTNVGNLL